MTTPAVVTSANEMTFVPRDLVSIQVGRLYASVYPKVEPTMPIHERAHAFQVIKSALESLPVDTRLILEAIGTQLNCNSQEVLACWLEDELMAGRTIWDGRWVVACACRSEMEIKVHYRQLARKYHPDKNDPTATGLTATEASDFFKLLNNTWWGHIRTVKNLSL